MDRFFFRDRSVLITGGLGFIGAMLARRLVQVQDYDDIFKPAASADAALGQIMNLGSRKVISLCEGWRARWPFSRRIGRTMFEVDALRE